MVWGRNNELGNHASEELWAATLRSCPVGSWTHERTEEDPVPALQLETASVQEWQKLRRVIYSYGISGYFLTGRIFFTNLQFVGYLGRRLFIKGRNRVPRLPSHCVFCLFRAGPPEKGRYTAGMSSPNSLPGCWREQENFCLCFLFSPVSNIILVYILCPCKLIIYK